MPYKAIPKETKEEVLKFKDENVNFKLPEMNGLKRTVVVKSFVTLF